MKDPLVCIDLLGRKQPTRLNWLRFARAIPGYIDQFAVKVPDNFYAQFADGVVEVACPCKVIPGPRCALLIPERCRCGRVYAYTGPDVRVAYVGSTEGNDGVTARPTTEGTASA